jgi:hypothetical protein
MAETLRNAAETMRQIRDEITTTHTNDLAVQSRHLCLGSMRDVAVVVGALGAGLLAGRVAAVGLAGRWRLMPFVIGGACLIAARFVPSEKMRFVTRSATVVGGSALMLSMIHFTLESTLEEALGMEA